ncbi:MAG: 50S ribosomal protein L11 methyltransferase [Flavobacteriales bacterium]|nr:50S ribosomal protein L11 methyltransferase [Flavobacteriales bacterium]
MPTTEVIFLLSPPDPWRDLLMVELAAIGYDSFEEGWTDPTGQRGELKAYVRSDRFDAVALGSLHTLRDAHVHVNWTSTEIADRNWNAEWESSFQPVEVDGAVRIRADFHEAKPGFAHEIVITPRMAFGTGHHATTRLMVQAMLPMDLRDKEICDLGCGTGILSILAERMGARSVRAIDIDPGAVDNAHDNMRRNGCHAVSVEKGDASSLKGHTCDTILANIERNILLDAMPLLSAALKTGGALLLSGFVPADRHMLAQSAKTHGLELAERTQEGEWALLGCRKP